MNLWHNLLATLRSISDGPVGSKRHLARLARLRDAIEVDPDPYVNLTTALSRSDLVLIGEVVQLYAYFDFNTRRIVSALSHAATGNPREPSRHSDLDAIRALDALAQEHLPDGRLKECILDATKILLLHRDHRHDFAHWATRRAKGVQAFVMFTMNAKAAKSRTGDPLEASASRFGIASTVGLRREVRKLKDHANGLALAAAHIDTHIVELRERIKSRSKISEERQDGE